MKPQIPNQKRKKSLKKEYDELKSAYTQFSRVKETKPLEKEDRIINIDQNNTNVIQSFHSDLEKEKPNRYMVRESYPLN